jgi:hypothetical protein
LVINNIKELFKNSKKEKIKYQNILHDQLSQHDRIGIFLYLIHRMDILNLNIECFHFADKLFLLSGVKFSHVTLNTRRSNFANHSITVLYFENRNEFLKESIINNYFGLANYKNYNCSVDTMKLLYYAFSGQKFENYFGFEGDVHPLIMRFISETQTSENQLQVVNELIEFSSENLLETDLVTLYELNQEICGLSTTVWSRIQKLNSLYYTREMEYRDKYLRDYSRIRHLPF